jgi:hypothetical protein
MEKVSTARIALKWGLIYGLVSIVINTIVYTFNLLEHQLVNGLISLVLSFAILYLAFKEFLDLNNGFMKFGQGVGLGILLFVTAGVLASAYDLVYKRVIDPTVVDKQLDLIQQQNEKMGMSPEMIEQAMEQSRPFIEGPFALIIMVLSFAFIGLLCSLIMAAIMKKNPPVFE